jgi:hypothetical protein
MNLRWLWLDHIDPALGLTSAQRRDVRRRAFDVSQRTPALLIQRRRRVDYAWGSTPPPQMTTEPHPGWVIFLINILLCIMLIVANPAIRPFAPLLVLVIAWVPYAWLRHQRFKPWINTALRELGHDVCLRCGYLLRKLPDNVDRCPECGVERSTLPEILKAPSASQSTT